jgi:hypothetical protein
VEGDRPRAGDRGQATIEWTGLVLVVAAVFAALVFAGSSVPGTALVHSISRSLLCAASVSHDCLGAGEVEDVYDVEISGLLRRHTPEVHFGPDLLGLPVDFRTCRSPACADPGGTGDLTGSTAGEPVTLFTRVIDCRPQASRRPSDCRGERSGNVYLQYWAYYPESASLRGVPVLEDRGYHPHDWESFQVRIGPGGEVSQRASSHAGYNHSRSAGNWGADAGWDLGRAVAEKLGLRGRGGWGPGTGRLLVAGGSHAGNVDGPLGEGEYPRRVVPRKVRLVPLEFALRGPLARPARFDPISPPWAKKVWVDPEEQGTG